MADRFWATQYPPVSEVVVKPDGTPDHTTRPRQFTDVRFHVERLEQPIRWQRDRRIFVNSMSDLFHESISWDQMDLVFAVMAICGGRRNRCFRRECDHEGFSCEENGASPRRQPIHTFQVLTKRPGRMRDYLSHPDRRERILDATQRLSWTWPSEVAESAGWPLENVHLGVTVEDQPAALERIPILLDTPPRSDS